jgi:hypothetical protein
VLKKRKDPLPLFLPAQTIFAQYDQSRMNRRLKKFNEVWRACGNHSEVIKINSPDGEGPSGRFV